VPKILDMVRKLKFLGFIILMTIFYNVKSQEYFNSLGLRISPGPGLTYKVFLNKSSGLEFLLSFPPSSLIFTGLYEYNMPVKNVKLLYWYIGCGGHIGFDNDESVIGFDLIVGLEYKIPDIPISVSLDLKPSFNFIPPGSYLNDFVGFSIRYTFK